MSHRAYLKFFAVIALSACLPAAAAVGEISAAASPSIQEFLLPDDLSAPNAIIVDNAGKVWFAEKVGKKIAVYDPEEKTFRSFAVPASWGNVGPARIALGTNGKIWFTVQRWADTVDRTNFLGELSPADGSFKKHDLYFKSGGGELLIDQDRVIPEDLLADGKGSIWFLVPGENALYRYDPAAETLKGYPIPTIDSYPRGIAVDGRGTIWFGEANANKIAEFDPKSAAFNEYEIPSPFSSVGELAVDAKGKIWFVEVRNNRLGVFSPDGKRFDEALLPAARSLPSDLAVGADGRIWFVEYLENKVGVFDPKQALFKEYVIPTPSSLPGGIVIDGERSRLWFSESNTEAKRLGMLDIGAAAKVGDKAVAVVSEKNPEKNKSGDGGYLGLIIAFGLLAAAAGAAFVLISRRGAGR